MLMRRLCLWCPIVKRNVIIMWIHVYPNWQMKFDSKKWWEETFFLWNQCINSFTPLRRMSLWHLIMNKMEIIIWIYVCPNWHMKFDYKNSGKWSFFMKPKHQFIYPNEEDEFVVPNHEKKRDFFANPSLSQLTYEL